MSTIDRLLSNYSRQVRLPWSANMSGKQRIWFAVYPPAEERRVRAKLPQFETLTLEANHGWFTVDLTRVLPEFLAAHKYRESIFENPQHLRAGSELEVRAAALVNEACSREDANAGSVVAVTGLASLFDFVRVSSLIERVISGGLRGRETLNRPIPARVAASCYKTGPKPCKGKPFGLPGVEIGEAKRKFRLRSSRPERISSSKQNER
jgi:hypothetical protein